MKIPNIMQIKIAAYYAGRAINELRLTGKQKELWSKLMLTDFPKNMSLAEAYDLGNECIEDPYQLYMDWWRLNEGSYAVTRNELHNYSRSIAWVLGNVMDKLQSSKIGLRYACIQLMQDFKEKPGMTHEWEESIWTQFMHGFNDRW